MAEPVSLEPVTLPSVNIGRVSSSSALNLGCPLFKVHVDKSIFGRFFHVHRDVVIHRSGFFARQANTTKGNVADIQVVDLPDVSFITFRQYLNLVYTNQLVTRGASEWTTLCQLFVLAEKLQDTLAKDQIIHGMHAFLRESVLWRALDSDVKTILPAAATMELYLGTTERCPARELLVEVYATCGKESWLRGAQGVLPAQFVCDVAVRLMQQRSAITSTFDWSKKGNYEQKTAERRPQTPVMTPAAVPAASSTEITTPTMVATTPRKQISIPFSLATPPSSVEKTSAKPGTKIFKAGCSPCTVKTPRVSIQNFNWNAATKVPATKLSIGELPLFKAGIKSPTIWDEGKSPVASVAC